LKTVDEISDELEGIKQEKPKLKQVVVFVDDIDKVKKQTVYQIWNQIVDCFDNLEKENKKKKYSAEDVRKKVKIICTKSIIYQKQISL